MREGRNEVLKTDLEIKEEAKRKSKILAIVLIAVIIIMNAITLFTEKELGVLGNYSIIWGIVLIVLIIVYSKLVFPYRIEQNGYAKRSIIYANSKLSAEEFLEVKPNPSKYEDFIVGLQEIAKFYAIIREEDDLIEIHVKFDFEEKSRKFENISKEYFYSCYELKE